jgi:hypothetical protein
MKNKNKILLFYNMMMLKPVTLLFALCVLFMVFVVPRMPASVTANSSERLRAQFICHHPESKQF